MAGTAVATTGTKRAFVFDPKTFDPKKAKAKAEQFAKAQGSSLGGNMKMFPGQKYSFVANEWHVGTKKDNRKELDGGTVLAVNVMSAAAAWVKWVDSRPQYHTDENGDVFHYLADPSANLPARESLGDNEPSEWETDDQGQPIDPWKCIIVAPCRDEEGDTVDHIETANKTNNNAFFQLFQEVAESMAMHGDELPLVELSSKKLTAKKKYTDKKSGKEKEKTLNWTGAVFEVKGWTGRKDCDNAPATDDDGEAPETTDEIGTVKATARTAPKKEEPKKLAPPKKEETKKAAAVKGKARRSVEPDEI